MWKWLGLLVTQHSHTHCAGWARGTHGGVSGHPEGRGKRRVGGPTGQTPPVGASLWQTGEPLPPGSLEGASTPWGEETGTAGQGRGHRGQAPLQDRNPSRVRAEGSPSLCCEWGPQGWQGAARRPQALPVPSLGPLLLCRIVAQPPSGAESRAWTLEGEVPHGPAWRSTRQPSVWEVGSAHGSNCLPAADPLHPSPATNKGDSVGRSLLRNHPPGREGALDNRAAAPRFWVSDWRGPRDAFLTPPTSDRLETELGGGRTKAKCPLFLFSSPMANFYSPVKAQPNVTSSGSPAPHHTCLRVS